MEGKTGFKRQTLVQKKEGRWQRFLKRSTLGILLAVVAIFAPCAAWTPDVFAQWQAPIAVFALVIYLGVVLFDTLFYDRYH